jgi:hypothetical protein
MDANSGRIYFTGVWNVVENGPDREPDIFMEVYLDHYLLEEWLENWMRMERGGPDSSPQALFRHMNDILMLNYIPPDSETTG